MALLKSLPIVQLVQPYREDRTSHPCLLVGRSSHTSKSRYFHRRGGASVSARLSSVVACSILTTVTNRGHKFVDVWMAAADGFVQPAAPSLLSVVGPCRGGLYISHDMRKVSVQQCVVVVGHESVQHNDLLH